MARKPKPSDNETGERQKYITETIDGKETSRSVGTDWQDANENAPKDEVVVGYDN